MSRRSSGDGSIHRSPDGAGWVATIELPARADGRRVRKKRRARTRAEAKQLLDQLRAEVNQYGGVGDGVRTIADTVEGYLQVRAAEGLAPKTLELDRWMGAIIIEGIGRKRSAALTVADCDRFLLAASRGLSDGRRGPRPIGRTHLRRLRSILTKALMNDLRLGLVTRNVAELSVMPPPTTEPAEKRALTGSELRRLKDASRGVLAVMVELCGRNGLRPAEARSLRWSSIDTDRLVLDVSSQMSAGNQVVNPKTKRAARTISFDQTTLGVLREWRIEQAALRERAGVAWSDHLGLVATTARGQALTRTGVRRDLVKACDRAGLEPITIYELRHTAITLQCEAGHPAFRIADWAGTSERMIADTYRHRLQAVSPLGPVQIDGSGWPS